MRVQLTCVANGGSLLLLARLFFLSIHVSLSSCSPTIHNFSPTSVADDAQSEVSAAYSSMLRTITAFLALGATAASPVSREASADFEAVASKLAGTSRRGYIDGIRLDPGVRFTSRVRFG